VLGLEVAAVVRRALEMRYTLLPHLYTLLYLHSVEGGTVARPLWHHFPRDPEALDVVDQFLWGSALLICPVLEQGATNRTIYLPPTARWFQITDFFQSSGWSEATPGWGRVMAPLATLPLYLRGGTVVPLQQHALTTSKARGNPMELLAALDSRQEAVGQLFWDDGEAIGTLDSGKYFLGKLEVTGRLLAMRVERDGMEELQFLLVSRVVVLGIKGEVEAVVVNGEEHSDWHFMDGGLFVTNLALSVNDNFQILF
jgi:alpha-glucosidase (family GH31 glycosyl hydrolase)